MFRNQLRASNNLNDCGSFKNNETVSCADILDTSSTCDCNLLDWRMLFASFRLLNKCLKCFLKCEDRLSGKTILQRLKGVILGGIIERSKDQELLQSETNSRPQNQKWEIAENTMQIYVHV